MNGIELISHIMKGLEDPKDYFYKQLENNANIYIKNVYLKSGKIIFSYQHKKLLRDIKINIHQKLWVISTNEKSAYLFNRENYEAILSASIIQIIHEHSSKGFFYYVKVVFGILGQTLTQILKVVGTQAPLIAYILIDKLA